MTDEFFDIFFSGKILAGNDPESVKQKVGNLFNANASVLEQLFSGSPVKIKKSVDMDTAIKYRVKFREIGAIVDIRPGSPRPGASPGTSIPPKPQAGQTTSEPASTSPANNATQELDTTLASPGSIIDETPPVPPAEYATDEFELGPANQGSLEEFAEKVLAAPLPDISALDISTSEGPLDATPPAAPLQVDTSNLHIDQSGEPLEPSASPAVMDIDISGLSASEPNTGSLEAFNTRPAPVPLPDISKLKME